MLLVDKFVNQLYAGKRQRVIGEVLEEVEWWGGDIYVQLMTWAFNVLRLGAI